MKALSFVTGNAVKFKLAVEICEQFGVKLEQTSLDIPEYQAENGEEVARDKAAQAFAQLQKPVVVTDDTWVIPALKGFPGPYMKSMNMWFTPQDWLNLTRDLEDRDIILRQIAVYQDEREQVLFSVDIKGTMLKEARGESKYSHNTFVSFDGGKHTEAEAHANGQSAAIGGHTAWHELAAWLKARSNEA